VQGKQARVKNTDLRHPSCTVVMQKSKSASPVLNVLRKYFGAYSLCITAIRLAYIYVGKY